MTDRTPTVAIQPSKQTGSIVAFRADRLGARLIAMVNTLRLAARLDVPGKMYWTITGGIGAGKSTALAAFRAHGAATVSSDEIVHHLLAYDDAVRDALVERLGDGVLGEDGRPDRAAIGRRVFGDAEALAWLEDHLHDRRDLRVLAGIAFRLDPRRGGGGFGFGGRRAGICPSLPTCIAPRQQFDRAHLAQIHANRIVCAI